MAITEPRGLYCVYSQVHTSSVSRQHTNYCPLSHPTGMTFMSGSSLCTMHLRHFRRDNCEPRHGRPSDRELAVLRHPAMEPHPLVAPPNSHRCAEPLPLHLAQAISLPRDPAVPLLRPLVFKDGAEKSQPAERQPLVGRGNPHHQPTPQITPHLCHLKNQ